MTTHVYTSFSYSYLNRARVLAASLKRQHSDWVIWAVITDREPAGFRFNLVAEDFDHMVTAEDLFGDATWPWLFGHDIVEACTAVKGRALLHIMAQAGVERVVFLDPDIAVFNPLDPVSAALEDHSIVLTPHQVDPDHDALAIHDNEITSLDYGIFNLGFFAVRNDAEAARFAAWWDERLLSWCHDRLDIGVFVDQKWCNLVPCFFDGVKILRDPGLNVASWNISQRRVDIPETGEILVNGVPLRFYHFTKLGPVGDMMTQRYAGNNTEVYELWSWYRREVLRHTDPAIPKGWWFYNSFADGTPVPKTARELYRSRRDLREHFPNPWLAGQGSYAEWLVAHHAEAGPAA
ncbi:MAG: hypothetical protein ACU0A9_12990 [Alterinioella nitratireducens]|uniref:hypothetical protein n=1 Tax=Alterinioella nitratireducens TaxID=2735915 RepID=UPI004059BF19